MRSYTKLNYSMCCPVFGSSYYTFSLPPLLYMILVQGSFILENQRIKSGSIAVPAIIKKKVFAINSNMLVKENVVLFSKLHLKMHSFYGTCPLTICPDNCSNKLVQSSLSKQKWEKQKILIHVLYTLILIAQKLFLEEDNVSLVTSVFTLFVPIANANLCVLKTVFFKRQTKFRELFNIFVEYENHQYHGMYRYIWSN